MGATQFRYMEDTNSDNNNPNATMNQNNSKTATMNLNHYQSSATKKKAIPVPVEKALKNFYSFLALVKEDLVCGVIYSNALHGRNMTMKDKQTKMIDYLEELVSLIPECFDLELPQHSRHADLLELCTSALEESQSNFAAAQVRWVDLLLDKVCGVLEASEHVNLEKLTSLMEQNDAAGAAMDDKDVVLFLGSPGSGKTVTLHYLAGTEFREETRGNGDHAHTQYRPVEVVHPSVSSMKINPGGKDVITRALQVAEVDIEGRPIVLCDTPSFGDHESIEEVMANSLGLVRAIQRAKTVRPVFVLSRDEIGLQENFHAYPQIMSILIRLLGTDTNVDLKPFTFVFTKYSLQNAHLLRKQFSVFLKDDRTEEDISMITTCSHETNKEAFVKHLTHHSNPEANIIIPTVGDPQVFLKHLISDDRAVVTDPVKFFIPNMPEGILNTLKRQLKWTLFDLKDALAKNSNLTAIHRMQQLSRLANYLPEAGIYARYGFKAFKEIINFMVEDDADESEAKSNEGDEDVDIISENDLSIGSHKSNGSKESWTSSESEQWSNVSSKLIAKTKSEDFMATRQLPAVKEEYDDERDDHDTEKANNMREESEPIDTDKLKREIQLNQVSIGMAATQPSATESETESTTADPDEAEVEVEERHSSAEAEPSSATSDGNNSESGYLEDDDEYAENYCNTLKEMTIKAIEDEDYTLAVERMRAFVQLTRQNPQLGSHSDFKKSVELFLFFSVALQEGNYHRCLSLMDELNMLVEEEGSEEAQRCADCGVMATVKHITELRQSVVAMTGHLHEIEDPEEFDQTLEKLRHLRDQAEDSNVLVKMCMRGNYERGKSEAVLACLSYGFEVGRLAR